MREIQRRPLHLSVGLPASFTRDIPHLREKTSRTGLVARALAIFRVDEVVIYNDNANKASEREGALFEKLLRYQETPQYLRRALFPQDSDLQFAGILPPIRLPSHPNLEEPQKGMLRDALAVESGEVSLVNAGFTDYVRLRTRLQKHERVTIRLTSTHPDLQGELVDPSRLPIYWGFRVTRPDSTLGRLITSGQMGLTISTSRNGNSIVGEMNSLNAMWKSARRAIVLFGSPDQGLDQMLQNEKMQLERVCDFNLNMIPSQGVETVRTEEALVASLAILNASEEM